MVHQGNHQRIAPAQPEPERLSASSINKVDVLPTRQGQALLSLQLIIANSGGQEVNL
jgi:hypothetical protein